MHCGGQDFADPTPPPPLLIPAGGSVTALISQVFKMAGKSGHSRHGDAPLTNAPPLPCTSAAGAHSVPTPSVVPNEPFVSPLPVGAHAFTPKPVRFSSSLLNFTYLNTCQS